MTTPRKPRAEVPFDSPDFDNAAEPEQESIKIDPSTLTEEDRRLFGQLDRDVVAWRPDPGEQIIGRIVSVVDAESEYGTYPLVELDVPDGPIVQVHCFHTILRNEVVRLGVRENDVLAIRYKGRSGKQDTAFYRVVVRRGPGGATYKPGANMPKLDSEPF